MKTIFVSSTFKDFQKERDALRDYVLPQINSIAKKYGETVDFCDLRWGINTSQLDSDETARKVLSVCLDEIDRCSPPMIVILGYRYGWIPDNQETIAFESRKRNLDLDDLEISVTALEVEYGALLSETKRKNTLFYFREIEKAPVDFYDVDEVSVKKLINLKKRILALSEGNVKSYSVIWNEDQEYDVENFVNVVRDDIINCYLPQWIELQRYSHTRRLIQAQKTIIEDKASRFFSRADLLNTYMNILENNNYLILKGESGSGKSMLFSKIVSQFEKIGWQIVPVFCGEASTSTAFDVLLMIVHMLEELLEKKPVADYDNKDKSICLTVLNNLCEEANKRQKKILLAIDAIDQLINDDDRKSLIFVPKCLNKTVKLIMTTQPHINLYTLNCCEVSMLVADEIRDFINGYTKCFKKELDSIVVEAIIEKGEKCTPLYLSLLLQRLTMMNQADYLDIAHSGDSIEAIIKKQVNIIKHSPDSIEQLCITLFDEAGKRINPTLSKEALKYISVSRLGLRICDLQTIIGNQWINLDFSLLISYLYDCFIIRKDGRVDFSHQIIKKAILKQYNEDEISLLNKDLYHYLYSLSDDDDIKLNEIGFHCIKWGDSEAYFSLIQYGSSNNSTFLKLLAKDTHQEYLPKLPSFQDLLSTYTDIISRLLVFSNISGCFSANNIVIKTALLLSEKEGTDVSLLGEFIINYLSPLFNSFSPIEVYGKLYLLTNFFNIFQTCAENDSAANNIVAFQLSLMVGDVFLEFSQIDDFMEHDDNQKNNREKATIYYQKLGLPYLVKLDGKVPQDQYLLYASSYNKRMEDASTSASEKSRYLLGYLININQILQTTGEKQIDGICGLARRAYYAAFEGSLFTKLYIEEFEEALSSIDYKSSPENMVKLLLHYYFLIITSVTISSEITEKYIYKALELIDEIILPGLSQMLLLEFIRYFIMIVEVVLNISNDSSKIEWIKAHIDAVINIIKNLYQVEPLLELAKSAVLLHYDLAPYGIAITGDDIEIYKKHIVDMASFHYKAQYIIDFLSKNGHDELQKVLKQNKKLS